MTTANSPLAPTTELEAVNQMLIAIGEATVASLDDTGLEDVETALVILRDCSRKFQSRGWYFNVDRDVLVTPDADGYINAPGNALAFDLSKSEYQQAVLRDRRLWNTEKHTFIWDRPMKCDITYGMPLEALPEAARCYIVASASRIYVRSRLGDLQAERAAAADERTAWVEWRRANNRQGDPNVYRNAPASWDVDRSSSYVYIRP